MVSATQPYRPLQGDIVRVQFDSTLGSERRELRPGLVISRDILSATSPFVWIVPISRGTYDYPFHVQLDARTHSQGTLFVEQPLSLDFIYHPMVFIERIPTDLLADVLHYMRLITSIAPDDHKTI